VITVSGTDIKIEGLDQCLEAFKQLDAQIRKNANGELRAASREIAKGIVAMLPEFAAGTGSPQAAKIAAAAGPKSDRYVVVAVPARKPRLSGAKKTPADMAKRLGWAIEGGSDYAPFKNPAAGSLVSKHRDRMAAYAVPRYNAKLVEIMRRYGLI
jgi:hypothetical protein